MNTFNMTVGQVVTIQVTPRAAWTDAVTLVFITPSILRVHEDETLHGGASWVEYDANSLWTHISVPTNTMSRLRFQAIAPGVAYLRLDAYKFGNSARVALEPQQKWEFIVGGEHVTVDTAVARIRDPLP